MLGRLRLVRADQSEQTGIFRKAALNGQALKQTKHSDGGTFSGRHLKWNFEPSNDIWELDKTQRTHCSWITWRIQTATFNQINTVPESYSRLQSELPRIFSVTDGNTGVGGQSLWGDKNVGGWLQIVILQLFGKLWHIYESEKSRQQRSHRAGGTSPLFSFSSHSGSRCHTTPLSSDYSVTFPGHF